MLDGAATRADPWKQKKRDACLFFCCDTFHNGKVTEMYHSVYAFIQNNDNFQMLFCNYNYAVLQTYRLFSFQWRDSISSLKSLITHKA